MNWKILGGVLLVVGLLAGLLIGNFSASAKVNGLNSRINELTAQVTLADSLKNQLAETKAQLDKLNVNELYGLVKVNGKAKAYKVGDLNKMPPAIANDVIGNTPVVVSWCPLCDTLTAYKREIDGKVVTFSEAGARKIPGTEIENLHFKDSETGSIWAQGPGIAVEGSKKGTELVSIPVQLFNKDRINKMGVEVWKP